MKKSAFFVITTMLYSSAALTDEVPPLTSTEQNDICVALAEKFATNASKSFQKELKQNIQRANLCKEEWSTANSQTRLGIKAWYEAFTGELNASDDRVAANQSKLCENHFGSYWEEKITSSEAQTVSKDGAEVVSNCLALTKASLLPTLIVSSDGKQFSISMQYRPDQPATTVIKMFGPMDLRKNTCEGTKSGKVVKLREAADIIQTINSSESITVRCSRESEKIKREGVDYDCAPETIIDISTSGIVAPTKIPKICIPSLQETHYDELKKQLAEAEKRLKVLEDTKITWLPQTKGEFDENFLKPLRDQLAGKVDAGGFLIRAKGLSDKWGQTERYVCLTVGSGTGMGSRAPAVGPCTEGPPTEWTTVMPKP